MKKKGEKKMEKWRKRDNREEGGGRERKVEKMIPRGQCHKSCNGRNRAGRRWGRGGPVKRQMRRTSF